MLKFKYFLLKRVGLTLPGLSATFRVGGDLRRVGGAGRRLQNTADLGHDVGRGEHISVHPLVGGGGGLGDLPQENF